MPADLPPVTLRGGSIHLPRELCDAHFTSVDSVALLVRDGALLIVPLMPGSAGGLLLKQRNARGDRVIHAQEFCRQHGIPESTHPQIVPVEWSDESAALRLHISFAQ